MKENLALQSFSLHPYKDNKEVIEKARGLGLRRMELCEVHVDFNDEKTFDGVIDLYRQAGIDIVSIGVEMMRNDPVMDEKRFLFAKKAGASHISVSFDARKVPEAFRTAEELAGKYDLKLGIHNHGGRHWLGSSEALSAVFEKVNPSIGLMLDTAWAIDSGEDPLKMVESFAGRLTGLHLKDFIYDRSRKRQEVAVGTGNLDLPGLFKLLKKMDFGGLLILEHVGSMETLEQSIANIRSANNH